MGTNVKNDFIGRRTGRERRTKRFGDLRWFLKTGRRRHVRRQADRRRLHMLDYYPPKLFLVLVVVLLLSIIDALLTLWLVDNGAVEINPVMAYYLKLGPNIFMATKYMITVCVVTIGVLLNYSCVRFTRFNFGQILHVFAGCFVMVVAWELFLIVRFVN
jgi:hypothetical protein